MSQPVGVSVIVPAYREREGLGAVLAELQDMAAGWDRPVEILVVDDASDDGTSDVAEDTGVRVVRHERNLGYGASLKTGVQAAAWETIAIIDADGTYPAGRIPELVDALE
ncbi:MAG TPA: glycosyltransferase family 2 protein, partial [Planctomycetaceae bacterium]|nr:glycosyltransferase family 2 protein [Planctomycetaceae bacterium]